MFRSKFYSTDTQQGPVPVGVKSRGVLTLLSREQDSDQREQGELLWLHQHDRDNMLTYSKEQSEIMKSVMKPNLATPGFSPVLPLFNSERKYQPFHLKTERQDRHFNALPL